VTSRTPAESLSLDKPQRAQRSKRLAILEAATREFAHAGYGASKWSDIADAVGIGSTALYHYFASKEDCLFCIMSDTLRASRDYFEEQRGSSDDPREIIRASIGHVFDGGELSILRNRVLNAEMHVLARAHSGPRREHDAYLEARGYVQDIVRIWTHYLGHCMRQSLLPEQDPHLLARGILGLSASVFVWYGHESTVPMPTLRETVVMHALALAYPPSPGG
jgi:AcrR family transcriptional regulator